MLFYKAVFMTHEMMTNFQFQPPRKHYNALQRIIYIARIQKEKCTGSVASFVRAKAVLSVLSICTVRTVMFSMLKCDHQNFF